MALTQVASGLIASVSGASLTGTQTIPKATLPTGSVLQVVNVKYDTTATSTSVGTTFDSGLTASITPSSATNKILVLVSSNGVQLSGSSYGKVTLTDGSNNVLTIMLTPAGYTNSSDESVNSISTCFYHSPGSTSTQTYKVRGVLSSGTAMSFQTSTGGNSESTITLMEIAA
jgi:hypothetical protein